MALTVVFVVVIASASGLMVARRASEALRAQRQADRALEASLEALRAGALELRSGALPLPAGPPPDRTLALRLEVVARGERGLHRVTVHAAYLQRGRPVERHLTSQVWRP